jgi:hypothetical protein
MNNSKIPKIIFQTWTNLDISEKLQNIVDTWKINNPDYEYFLYDNDNCRNFIVENFSIDVINAYDKINTGAFKSDLWRYCILYKYGGFYADIDTLCLGKIDDFINESTDYIIPIDLNVDNEKYCLFNAFIGTVPKNPILLECIAQIVHNVKNDILPSFKLNIAGPGLIGQKTNVYMGLDQLNSFVGKEGIVHLPNNTNNQIKTLHFLKFERYLEYVTDTSGNILFQNKNGNEEIKYAYNEECKKRNVSDWSLVVKPY